MNNLNKLIELNIKRAINFVDTNNKSETYGSADRLYWSWRLKDFSNGSFQSLTYFFSELMNNSKFNNIYIEKNVDSIIDESFDASLHGTFKIQAKNGSFSESFPGENSFCVTATVLNDIVSAINNQKNEKELLEVYYTRLLASYNFLINNIENHALIGNHLMTALSALIKFNTTFNENKNHNLENILKKLRTIWNEEGWFGEYSGSDIGYLTLTLDYLIDIPDDVLEDKSLWQEKILLYLLNFFHKDGSIGNIYGSRGSSLIYPYGIAKAGGVQLFEELSESINLSKIPRPENVDDTNFVPLLNSFIKFLSINFENKDRKAVLLPKYEQKYLKAYKDAGFVILVNKDKQTIIDTNNSSSIHKFTEKSREIESSPLIVKDKKILSAQTINRQIDLKSENHIIIKTHSSFSKISTSPINVFQSVLIRLFTASIGKNKYLLSLSKKYIVNKFFSSNKTIGSFDRNIEIRDQEIILNESFDIPQGFTLERSKFHNTKMASQNYF